MIAMLMWALLASAQAPQPARDLPRSAPTGTATISGVVLLDVAETRPLRRVRVTLNAPDLQIGRTVITEDDGSFVFASLPAGKYTIGVSKPAYVSVNFGASRPGRPGTPVVVRDGERTRISIRMPAGAVITGTVLDVDGRPAQGFPVRALRHVYVNGERQLMPAGNSAVTDDRGIYRIYGLQAGDYIVTGSPRGTAYASTDVQVMSDAAHRFGFASVYYPSGTTLTQAGTIALRQAEERGGIDLQAQLVPMARISGTVAASDGSPRSSTMMNLLPTATGNSALAEGIQFARAAADGTFAFGGVAPGRYVIMARDGGAPTAPAPVWATAEVAVEGNDVTDIALALQPGFTLSGRIAFDGERPAPPDLSSTRVTLQAVQSAGQMTMLPSPTKVDAQGQFTIEGITPGRYRLSATLKGPQGETGWWLKSSIAGGRETLDAPIELRESIPDAVITFSDRATELTGVVRDGTGASVAACFVIAAPVDRGAWAPESRRIVSVQPTSDGKYTLRNLPPGEYFITAVVDVEQGEWFDPRFLDLVKPGASRLALSDGEQKTQDLVVR